MAILGDTQFLERITFFDGQRLLAADLQDLERFEREMRCLHNMSLHQAGVGSGYAVSGKKGDRQVTISPGYAIDALGREIILTMPDTQQVPPVPDNGAGQPALYDLVVSYPPSENLSASETRSGVCADTGTVRRHEEPVFCWARLTDDGKNPADPRLNDLVQQQLMIVLARVAVQNCQLKADVSVAIRRNARPPQLPKVAAGVNTVKISDMLRSNLTAPAGANTGPAAGANIAATQPAVYRLSTLVNTASAGFASVPAYYARIRNANALVVAQFAFGSVVHLTSEGPTSFQFELLWSSLFLPRGARAAFGRSTETLDIVWIGVEV